MDNHRSHLQQPTMSRTMPIGQDSFGKRPVYKLFVMMIIELGNRKIVRPFERLFPSLVGSGSLHLDCQRRWDLLQFKLNGDTATKELMDPIYLAIKTGLTPQDSIFVCSRSRSFVPQITKHFLFLTTFYLVEASINRFKCSERTTSTYEDSTSQRRSLATSNINSI